MISLWNTVFTLVVEPGIADLNLLLSRVTPLIGSGPGTLLTQNHQWNYSGQELLQVLLTQLR